MPDPLESHKDDPMTAFCMRHWYHRFIAMTCVAGTLAIAAGLFAQNLLAICGSVFVIVVIVYIEGQRRIRSNVESNTKRQHVLSMMLGELISMQIKLEKGKRMVYEDGEGMVGFVNEVFAYDWCDRLAVHSGASFHVIISQTRIHDIVNLAKDHNYYRQKLEDLVIPNRADGVLPEKHAKCAGSYCEVLLLREVELARILPEAISKGKELINSISINICKRSDSVSP